MYPERENKQGHLVTSVGGQADARADVGPAWPKRKRMGVPLAEVTEQTGGVGAHPLVEDACCASTSPRPPTWPCTPRSASHRSRTSSMPDHANDTSGPPQPSA